MSISTLTQTASPNVTITSQPKNKRSGMSKLNCAIVSVGLLSTAFFLITHRPLRSLLTIGGTFALLERDKISSLFFSGTNVKRTQVEKDLDFQKEWFNRMDADFNDDRQQVLNSRDFARGLVEVMSKFDYSAIKKYLGEEGPLSGAQRSLLEGRKALNQALFVNLHAEMKETNPDADFKDNPFYIAFTKFSNFKDTQKNSAEYMASRADLESKIHEMKKTNKLFLFKIAACDSKITHAIFLP